MKEEKIELLKNVVNCPVVKVKGRAYPGLVLQGDTLYSLYRKSENVLKTGKDNNTSFDLDAAEYIRDTLKEYLSIYENALLENGYDLPYVKP